MLLTVTLLAVAGAFVFVCGANDGGALLLLAVRYRFVSAAALLALLGGVLAVAPQWIGLGVARTFSQRLAGGTTTGLLAGAAVAVALVLLMTWRGVPTSITLAVLGGLAGAGTGLGTPPAWGTLVRVLAIGAVAPFAGGLLGYLLGRTARRMPTASAMPRVLRCGQVAALGGQCLAYAANDGQKMYAVLGVAVAVGHGASATTGPHPSLWLDAAIAAVFVLGAAASLRRVIRGASASLRAARGWEVVSAELASSAAVLGSAGLGVPVSMSQSITGGLVGAAVTEGARRVRWQYVLPVVVTWLVTLPASFAAGLAAGLTLRGLR